MISAAFSSKCPDCGEEIHEGDLIGLVDDAWVCAACVDLADGEDDEREEEDA